MFAIIFQALKPIWKIVYRLAIILILSFIAINNSLVLGAIFGAFGYSDADIHSLKGWNGFWKIWRSFNRTYIIDGLFLSLFSSTKYSKEEIQDELLVMQNFAQVFKIFATGAIMKYLSGKSGVSTFAIIKATVLRFLIISCLADLILNAVFFQKANSGETVEAVKQLGKDMETSMEQIDNIVILKEKEETNLAEKQAELTPLKKELKQAEKNKKKKKKKAEALQTIKTVTPKIDQLEKQIEMIEAKIKEFSKAELKNKQEYKKLRGEYKKLRYKILVEERQINSTIQKYIPKDSDGPEGPNKPMENYQKKIEDGALFVSYVIAAFINVMVYSMVNNVDRKPLQITLITLLITLGLILPFADILTGRKSDFDDFNHKESTLQNFINKYHPNSMNPKAKNVKAGYDYDPYYTTQALVFFFVVMMTILHLFFSIWEAPKDLNDCNKGPLSAELATVSTQPEKELQVCPEDRKMYGNLGYYPQTIYKRLLGGMQQRARYEMLYVFVPCVAGIIEGKTALSEGRKAGITAKYMKSELKRKGFAFGYWRAVIVILFASKLINSEAIAALRAKAANSMQNMRKGAGQKKFKMPSFMKKK
tara:strand:- start:3448 stop:5223 length:1776 start_codon:yes stop_codon:yes gene_type:complete